MDVTLGEHCPVALVGCSECQGKGRERNFTMVREEPMVRGHLDTNKETKSQGWSCGSVREEIINVTMRLWLACCPMVEDQQRFFGEYVTDASNNLSGGLLLEVSC